MSDLVVYQAPFGMYGNSKVKNWHFSLMHTDASLWMIMSEFLDEPYLPKTRMLGLSDREGRVILA